MSTKQKIRKNISAICLASVFLFFAFAPMAVLAQAKEEGHMFGISYTCTGTATDANGENPHTTYDCETFGSLISAIKNITNFAVVYIALPFSVIVIIYVGAEYMMYSDNPGKRSEATKRFEKVAWGIFWVLAAWLIVNLIMTTLTNTTGSNAIPQFLSNS